jgi:hypothetical protein
LGQWSAAASAVFIAAVVGGTLGAPVVRKHEKIGALLTFCLALIVAIAALPLLPALLGQHVGVGGFCIDGCDTVVNTEASPFLLFTEFFFIAAALVEPWAVLTLALGVAVWAHFVRRFPQVSSDVNWSATGVYGVVLAGPTCPVEQAGQSPCVRPIFGATIAAFNSAGHLVRLAVSDTTGAYFLQLPPGTYTIVPQAVEGLLGVPAHTTVTVPHKAPVRLDLPYDTGLR